MQKSGLQAHQLYSERAEQAPKYQQLLKLQGKNIYQSSDRSINTSQKGWKYALKRRGLLSRNPCHRRDYLRGLLMELVLPEDLIPP